jgi:sialate O-acetylesterase
MALVAGVLSAQADVRLPAVLGDHMVLQQQCEVTLWGWAYAGESVLIETSWGVKTQTSANASGTWRVTVRTPAARPLSQGLHRETISFTVPGENSVQLKDLLIGEVWLCGGQSNMTMMLGPDYPAGNNGWYGDKFWPEELPRTDRPALRVFNVEKTARAEPQDDCKGVLPDHIFLPKNAEGLTADLRTGWQISSRDTAPFFSAVAYYFGVKLQETLNVPVGLVTSSVGGSPIEAWMSVEALRRLPAYAQATNKVHRNGPAALYNGMLAPLTPMTLRGAIWYQGESNAGASTADYAALLTALIADWRAHFGKELPFGIVQLANYGEPWRGTRATLVREAQAAVAAQTPGVGLAVAVDLGEVRIHPPDKRNVADRLARWARAKVYGDTKLVFQSPLYKSCAVSGGKIRLQFDTGGARLMVGQLDDLHTVREASGQKLQGFELAGGDGKFVTADAVLEGDQVVLSAAEVPSPTMARYAWATNPQGCNLYNHAGLPAAPFRTHDK